MKKNPLKSYRVGPMALCAAAWMLTTLVSPSALAKLKEPTPAKSRAALPAEVRAMLPEGATSLHFGRLPAGPKGEAMLVHIWTVGRKTGSIHNRNQ